MNARSEPGLFSHQLFGGSFSLSRFAGPAQPFWRLRLLRAKAHHVLQVGLRPQQNLLMIDLG